MPTKNQSSVKNQEDEFTDIFDVLSTIWQARVGICIGIGVGLLFAYFAACRISPNIYLTAVPVKLHSSTNSDLFSLVSKFNQALQRANVANAISSVPNSGLRPQDVPKRVKLQMATATDVFLEWSSKDSDNTGNIARSIANTAAYAMRIEGEKIQAFANAAANANIATASTRIRRSDLEIQYSYIVAAELKELSPLKVKLFALEAKISKQKEPSLTHQLNINTKPIDEGVLRILGYSQNRLTKNDQSRALEEYIELNSEIQTVQAKYEQPKKILMENLKELSSDLIEKIIGPRSLLPIIEINDIAYAASISTKSHEQYKTSSKLTAYVLGSLAGAFLGFFIQLLRKFIKSNKSELLSIFIDR